MFYYSNKPRSATGSKNGRKKTSYLTSVLEKYDAEAGTSVTINEYARVLYKTLAVLVKRMEKTQGGDPDGSIMAAMKNIYAKFQSLNEESEEVPGERSSPSTSSINTTISISSNKNKVLSSSSKKRTATSYTPVAAVRNTKKARHTAGDAGEEEWDEIDADKENKIVAGSNNKI